MLNDGRVGPTMKLQLVVLFRETVEIVNQRVRAIVVDLNASPQVAGRFPVRRDHDQSLRLGREHLRTELCPREVRC